MSKTKSAIAWMEQIAADDSHGYSQYSRWGNPDYDCSSLVITAWKNVGIPLTCSYTGNMYSDMIYKGFNDVTDGVDLSTGEGLKRGDVLLNHQSHVAMYCGNGKEVEASQDENGGIGGQPGDQTGTEILVRSYRNYPWNAVLRYMDSGEDEASEDSYCFAWDESNPGDQSLDVWRLQMVLKARGFYKGECDRSYGNQTIAAVKAFQKKAGLTASGKADRDTLNTLLGLDRSEGKYICDHVSLGDMKNKSVLLCQEFMKASGYYNGKLDWNFGKQTEKAVRLFQRAAMKKNSSIAENGEWDRATARHAIGEK